METFLHGGSEDKILTLTGDRFHFFAIMISMKINCLE